MASTREQKEVIVSDLVNRFERAKLVALVDYRGITVEQLQTLRQQASEKGVDLKVVKNRLVKQAFSQIKGWGAPPTIRGMTLYVFSDQDEVAGAQLIKDFAKKSGLSLELVGAIDQAGHWLDQATTKHLAGLPNKEDSLALLLAQLKSPVSNLRSSLGNQLGQIIASLKTE